MNKCKYSGLIFFSGALKKKSDRTRRAGFGGIFGHKNSDKSRVCIVHFLMFFCLMI